MAATITGKEDNQVSWCNLCVTSLLTQRQGPQYSPVQTQVQDKLAPKTYRQAVLEGQWYSSIYLNEMGFSQNDHF